MKRICQKIMKIAFTFTSIMVNHVILFIKVNICADPVDTRLFQCFSILDFVKYAGMRTTLRSSIFYHLEYKNVFYISVMVFYVLY